MIRSLDDLKVLVEKMDQSGRPIGFDIETGYDGPPRIKSSLFPHAGSFIVGFSMTVDSRWARYVPLQHDFGPNLDPDEVWPVMKPLLEQKRVVAHNLKFEKRNLRTVGIEIGAYSDSMIEAYCLSEWKKYGLKDLVKEIFGHQMTEIHDLFPDLKVKDRDTLRFNAVDVNPETVEYACEDAVWCLALHERHYERVLAERGDVYKIEMQVLDLMCDLEDRGVAVDWEGMERARAESIPFIAKFESELKADLGALVGHSLVGLNLNSATQMRKLLYSPAPEGLGLKTTRRTKNDSFSTDAVAMARLARDYPAIQKLLQLREVQNLRRRLEIWLEEDKRKPAVRGLDGRVHAGYSQVRVGSGRFAANDPAIQQCPKDWNWALAEGSQFEGNFRDFLVAAPDHYLLSFDYSQIELRVMAGLSQEPALLEAFDHDQDVHTITAAKMLGKRPDEVDAKIERPIGKTMNFALLYGMGPQSLSERLAISRERANELYQAYFSGFPSITRWMDQMKSDGTKRGFTLSWIGRKYTVWELQSSNPAIYSKAERVLVNVPVQGGAADYVKIAMLRVRAGLEARGWWNTSVRMIMNQHDALTFEVSQDLDPREVLRVLRPAVEFPVKAFPKIITDWEFGYRWGSGSSFNEQSELSKGPDGWQIGTVAQAPAREDRLLHVVEVEEAPDRRLREEREGRTVVVRLSETPTEEQYARFISWVRVKPGVNSVVVRLPDETEVSVRFLTSLDLTDRGRVAVIFPGAKVFYPADEVDTEDLAVGLVL